MIVLQIEHKVQSYEGWKKAFDNDPIDRRKAGVRQHRIFRPLDDPNYVVIQLYFDTSAEAGSTLSALRNLWPNVEGKVIFGPQTRMFDATEIIEY